MAIIASRLSNNGTLLVNGSFDEVTYNTNLLSTKNLASFPESFNNAYWGKQSGLTVTANTTIAPDGTLTADTLNGDGISTGYLGNVFNYTSGVSYVFSFYAKANTTSTVTILLYGTAFNNSGTNPARIFNLSNGTSSSGGGTVAPQGYGIIDVGNGWYRCWIAQTATSTGSNSQQEIRLSGLSDSIFVWGYQIEVGTTPSVYQPHSATGTVTKQTSNTLYTSGNFDEVTFNSSTPAIKNILKFTQELGTANYWYTGTASNVTSNVALAPDNTFTADKILQTTTTNRHGLQSPTLTVLANTAYTVSCYAKAAENNFVQLIYGKSGSPYTRAGSTVDLTTGALNSGYTNGTPTSVVRGTPIYVGNGWWYIYLTVVMDSTSTDGYVEINTLRSLADLTGYLGPNNTDGTYVWGLQLEQSANATIYQPVSNTNSLVVSPIARKIDNSGNYYVQNTFDEYTGAPVVDSNTRFWIDISQSNSYPGGNTIYDLSGSNLNMTLHNTSYISQELQGMKFTRTTTLKDGGGAYVSNPTGPMAVSNFLYNDHTWEVWFKINDITAGNYDITEGFSTLCLYNGYHAGFQYTSSNMLYYIWTTGPAVLTCASWTAGVSGAQINQGQWYQIVVTRKGNVFTPYVNGVQLGTGSTNSPVYTVTSNVLHIGKTQNLAANTGSYVGYSKNTVDVVRMYDRALSDDEIAQNFNAHRNRYGI
jgi:hypothetical protein